MASIIRIKRSGTSGSPASLAQGELAYSYLGGTEINGGDRLYIGTGTESANGEAQFIDVIGGKYFTQKLDHTPGVITANSAIIVDNNKKIDELTIDNIKIDGNTISNLDVNGSIIINPNGSGSLDVSNSKIVNLSYPSANTDAANKQYVDDEILDLSNQIESAADLDFAGDSGTGSIVIYSEVFTIGGGTGLTTTASNNSITIDLDNTTVTPGTYGSSTSIPTFTVDAQGRLTDANTVTISTDLTFAGDTGSDTLSLLNDVLSVIGQNGISTSVADNVINVILDDTDVVASAYGAAGRAVSFIVDDQGRLTAASDTPIEIDSFQITDFSEAVQDVVGDFVYGDINSGIVVSYFDAANTLVVSADDATATTKGVAKFDANNFLVSNGNVTTTDMIIGSTPITNGDTVTDFAGLTSLVVDNLSINGNSIISTDTDGDIIISPNGTGSVDVGNSKIVNLSYPTLNTDAATKEYVDTIASASLHYHDPVRIEFPTALTATYNNGTDGVGATLTNSGAQEPLVGDGITLDVGDRVLVYQQANAAHNGIYEVTDTGSLSTNWVLTRTADTDSYAPSDPNSLGTGDAFYVKEGITGAGELYVMTTEGVITFGTTNIQFSQISAAQIYSAGEGLSLDGVTFNVNVDDSTIEIVSDTLQVKDLGITNAKLAGSITNDKLVNSTITLASDVGVSNPIALGETLTFTGGQSIQTSVADNTITFDAAIASTTTVGVSSFNASNFTVSVGGEVAIVAIDGGSY